MTGADDTGAARRWLAGEARGVRAWLAASVAAGLVATAATIAQAGLIALAVDRAFAGHWGAAAPTILAGLIAAIALRALGQWGQQAAGAHAAGRVQQRVRARLLAQLGRLGPVGVADQRPGDLAARVVDRIDALEGYFARYLPQVVLAVAAPLAILATVAALDWLAALLLLAAAPLIPLFMALVGMGAEQLNRRQAEWINHLAGHFLDRVRGLVTLQLFDRTAAARADVAEAAQAYRRITMRTLRVAFLSSAVLEFFASVAIAVVAIYIGFGLLGYIGFGPAGELDLFAGLFVLLLAPEFFAPLRSLAQHYHDRAAALGVVPGLTEILERPAPAPPAPVPRERASGGVVCDRVTLAYDPAAPVLRDVTWRAAPGACVVLTGPSGGGKSTLLAALAGFLAPVAGTVEVAGGDPGAPGVCAWLGQRPWLVPGSLADNIRLARPEASDAAVAEAVAAADVTAFAERAPEGLDARVGEGGHGLSGGQAQRVALARALLAEAPVVLLDEPTAKLDPEAAARVVAALQRLTDAGRTVVIAGHDPGLLALADRRLHVADGRVTEVAVDD